MPNPASRKCEVHEFLQRWTLFSAFSENMKQKMNKEKYKTEKKDPKNLYSFFEI